MLIDDIHKKYEEYADLRLRSVVVDKKGRKIVFNYSYPSVLLQKSRDIIFSISQQSVDSYYSIVVNYENDSFTSSSLKKFILNYIETNAVSLHIESDMIQVSQIDERAFRVVIYADEVSLSLIKTNELISRLNEVLSDYTCYNVAIKTSLVQETSKFETVESQMEADLQVALSKELCKPQRYWDITDVKRTIGRRIELRPRYAIDAEEPNTDFVACGKITDISFKRIKTLTLQDTEMCLFTIEDLSGKLDCVLFTKYLEEDVEKLINKTGESEDDCIKKAQKNAASNSDKSKLIHSLTVGSEIAVEGYLQISRYTDRIQLKVNNLSFCKILPTNDKLSFRREVPTVYCIITPQPITTVKQMSLVKNEETKSDVLAGKIVIMFLNTTGNKVLTDKIVQIGCVKMERGIRKESFYALVDTERAEDEAFLNEIGENRQSFSSAYSYMEVCPDLYKFCYGYKLVVMNSELCESFLKYNSSPLGFDFNNGFIELSSLFDIFYASNTARKKPNTNKLSEVGRDVSSEDVKNKNALSLALYVSDILLKMFA